MINRVGIASAGAALLWLAIAVAAPDHALAQQFNVQPPQAPQPAQPAAVTPQSPAVTPQPVPPAQPEPAKKEKEGFFDALGKWWDKSAAEWNDNMKKFKSTIDETNERNAKAAADATRDAALATKDATDALIKLPMTRLVEGREKCQLAPNGSPDCNAAAEQMCKAKGFATGKSADIQSARKCSGRALWTRSEEGCVNETIVIKAACQ